MTQTNVVPNYTTQNVQDVNLHVGDTVRVQITDGSDKDRYIRFVVISLNQGRVIESTLPEWSEGDVDWLDYLTFRNQFSYRKVIIEKRGELDAVLR